jgi:hypothetical protein
VGHQQTTQDLLIGAIFVLFAMEFGYQTGTVSAALMPNLALVNLVTLIVDCLTAIWARV